MERLELFLYVLGGYGFFGVILEVELMMVLNEFYCVELWCVWLEEYEKVWCEVVGDLVVGMVYGWLSVVLLLFLEEGVIVGFK